MTTFLRSSPDELEALIAAAAAATGVSAEYVEKDFWATEVLRAACVERLIQLPSGQLAPVSFVFKGGTSLSRVFRLTQRFSEDIDLLAVFPDQATLSARHSVLKQVDVAVSAHLALSGVVVPGSSTTGVKRYTTYRYATQRSSGVLREGVLLELGSRGGTQPAAVHAYTSMVADFARDQLGEGAETWAEFAEFDVLSLAAERTLLEKLSGVHTMAMLGDRVKLLGAGRHLYDIACLLKSDDVVDALQALGQDGIAALTDDIEKHSLHAGFASVPRPSRGFATSPAFDPSSELHAVIVDAYEKALPLVHGSKPSSDEMFAVIRERAHLL